MDAAAAAACAVAAALALLRPSAPRAVQLGL